MPKKMILFSGASAVGKTAVLKRLLPYVKEQGHVPMVCKIDCIRSEDGNVFREMGFPTVTGLAGDICPDHFLVSNLPELWNHADQMGCDLLFIETAGLCHRCSPATVRSAAGCVLDCTSSLKSPSRLGPMVAQADFIIPTKIDMVSQAELEIIRHRLSELNPSAMIFPVDGLYGYGTEFLGDWLMSLSDQETFEGDLLRHTMPAGVCSYCVGERRVGSMYQQGVIGKIDFKEETAC
jgi:Ni2+-binding GTPase involved in maturation of urease and hydrogenase